MTDGGMQEQLRERLVAAGVDVSGLGRRRTGSVQERRRALIESFRGIGVTADELLADERGP